MVTSATSAAATLRSPLSLVAARFLLLRGLLVLVAVGILAVSAEELHFADLFTDSREQVLEPRNCTVQGTVPSYLQGGSSIRNGPALWSAGSVYYQHLFDGAARLTKYSVLSDGDGVGVTFQTRFIESKQYEAHIEDEGLSPMVTVGAVLREEDDQPAFGLWDILMWLIGGAPNSDNCVVNLWNFDPLRNGGVSRLWAITETAPMALVDPHTLATVVRPSYMATIGGAEVTNMLTPHPEYCKKGTGATYNVHASIGGSGVRIDLVRSEQGQAERTVVASLVNPDGGIPFLTGGLPTIHSFGLTPTRALILLQPLRMPLYKILGAVIGGVMGQMQAIDKNHLWVVELETGQHNLIQLPELFYSYHTASATDEADGIHSSLRLIASTAPHAIIGEYALLKRDKAQTAEDRDKIPTMGNLVDIRTDGATTATVQWYSLDESETFRHFDLPTHRYSRAIQDGPWNEFRHPRYLYALAMKINGVDHDSSGLVKVDTESTTTNSNGEIVPQILSFRESSQYVSEATFVPDPNGIDEDDGVVLSHVYDGIRRESYLLVLDAKTMEPLAKAYSGSRGTDQIHGGFFQLA